MKKLLHKDGNYQNNDLSNLKVKGQLFRKNDIVIVDKPPIAVIFRSNSLEHLWQIGRVDRRAYNGVLIVEFGDGLHYIWEECLSKIGRI